MTEEFREEFARESEEQITELNNALLSFESDPTDEEAMEQIFRTAHTLKSNCGAMGFEAASDVAHAVEDLLEAVKAGRVSVTPEVMDAVFEGVDELEAAIGEAARHGEVRRDPSDVIETLREYADAEGLSGPSDDEIEAVVEDADPPSKGDHSVYHVRLTVAGNPATHGRAVVDALEDAFDLLGTDPARDAISAGDYDGTFDAVFASVVRRGAVEAALDPVDAVADHVVTDVTDHVPGATGADTAAAGDAGGAAAAAVDPDELSVDELLEVEDVDQFDDLDELAEEVEDASEFDDIGDAGSFAELGFGEDDVSVETPTADASGDASDDADAASASDGATAGDADDAVVQDATAEFEQLKAEVEPVGFDELQEEIEQLEFDEYDSDDEVGFDELLGDEVLADESEFGATESVATAADEPAAGEDRAARDVDAESGDAAAADAASSQEGALDDGADAASAADESDAAGDLADETPAPAAASDSDVTVGEAQDAATGAPPDAPSEAGASVEPDDGVTDDGVTDDGVTDDDATDDGTTDDDATDGFEADEPADAVDAGADDSTIDDGVEASTSDQHPRDATAADLFGGAASAGTDESAPIEDESDDEAVVDAGDEDPTAETPAAADGAPEADDVAPGADEGPHEGQWDPEFDGEDDVVASQADDDAASEAETASAVEAASEDETPSEAETASEAGSVTAGSADAQPEDADDAAQASDEFGNSSSVLDLDAGRPAGADDGEVSADDEGLVRDDGSSLDDEGFDEPAEATAAAADDAESEDDDPDAADGTAADEESLPGDSAVTADASAAFGDEDLDDVLEGARTVGSATDDGEGPVEGDDGAGDSDDGAVDADDATASADSVETDDGIVDGTDGDDERGVGIEDVSTDEIDEILGSEGDELDVQASPDDVDASAAGLSTGGPGGVGGTGLGTDASDRRRPQAPASLDDPGFADPVDEYGDAVVEAVDEDRLERIRSLGVPERDDDVDDAGSNQSVRVDVGQLDEMLNLVEGLVTSRARLRRALEADEPYAVLEEEVDDLEDVTSELQDAVMDVRLVPLRRSVSKLPRIVRDVAREQDKDVTFELEGEDVELDRSVLEEIGDPLVHLVRNAVDHGIEPPAERADAGKDETGSVRLTARRERDRVVVAVEDDGRGIDPDDLRDAAVEEGVYDRETVEELDDDEAMELVFHPGLSTAEEVTDVSGRGVGMDVVAETVEELDGDVTVESEPGEGTTVELELPVTLAIAEMLFLEVGGEEYGVPVDVVGEIGPVVGIETQDGREVLVSDGGEDQRELIRLDEALDTEHRTDAGRGMLVHLRDDVREATLLCDGVRGQQEIVVKPFEGVLESVPGIAGATVLGDGDVVNILDVESL